MSVGNAAHHSMTGILKNDVVTIVVASRIQIFLFLKF